MEEEPKVQDQAQQETGGEDPKEKEREILGGVSEKKISANAEIYVCEEKPVKESSRGETDGVQSGEVTGVTAGETSKLVSSVQSNLRTFFNG